MRHTFPGHRPNPCLATGLKLLDDASESDVNVVRIRLTEEKSKRILLQNDVETLMVKVESLERKLNGTKNLLSCN